MFHLIALLFSALLTGSARTQPPPNIVLVLADDLGIGDLGCYNAESKIPTPRLDRFASEGVRFTDMHSPSAVCTPTRYGLLTGRYCWRTRVKSGVLDGYSPLLIETGRATLASLLHDRGYATACFGKWHLGLGDGERTDYTRPLTPGPNSVGFDEFFGIGASLDMPPYVYVRDTGVLAAPTLNVAGSAHRRQNGGGYWRGGAIAPGFAHGEVLDAIVDRAISFIERQGDARRFFAYVPLTAPHTPWVPTPAWRGRTQVGYYGDFVAMVDATVGRILDALDRAGIADDTLVIVTSDNGSHWPLADIEKYGHRANLCYRGQKADIHEGGHRVPFLARWPGRIEAGSESGELGCLTDLFATFTAIVGARLPHDAGEDSYDLSPVLLGAEHTAPIRPAIVHHSLAGMFAIRAGRWKLVFGLGSGGFTAPREIQPKAGEPPGQLYDLDDDPGETRNLWAQNPAIVARLTELLAGYRSSGRSR